MKRIFLIFILAITFSYKLHAQSATTADSLDLLWAKSIGGTKEDKSTKMAKDSQNNIYITGTFEGQINLLEINTTLTSNGEKDILLVKYNSKGQLLRATSYGSTFDDLSNDITIDDNDNVYLAGFTEKKSAFVGYEEIEKDMFWSQFDKDLKKLQDKIIGSKADEEILSINVDSQNSIVVVGYFRNDINFDSTRKDLYFATKGYSDTFFAKYNAQGICKWVKTINLRVIEMVIKTRLDKDDNIIIAGEFISTCDFDPSNSQSFLTSKNFSTDIFVAQYTNDGNFKSANMLGSTGMEKLYDLQIDRQQNIILCGRYSGLVDFDWSDNQQTLIVKKSESFLASYSKTNSFNFVKTFNAIYSDRNNPHIIVDYDNNIYICGTYLDQAIFNNDNNKSFTITSAGGSDIYITKYNTAGNLQYTQSLGYNENETFTSAVSINDTLIVSGYFTNNSILSTTNYEAVFTGKGETDILIFALNTQPNSINNKLYTLSGRVNADEANFSSKITLWEKINGTENVIHSSINSDDGTFAFKNLSLSTYTIEAIPQSNNTSYQTTYYVNKSSLTTANWIALIGNTRGLDLQMQKKKFLQSDEDKLRVEVFNDGNTLLIWPPKNISNPTTVTIYNSQGVAVNVSKIATSTNLEIGIQNLPNNVYVVVIIDDNNNLLSSRFVKP